MAEFYDFFFLPHNSSTLERNDFHNAPDEHVRIHFGLKGTKSRRLVQRAMRNFHLQLVVTDIDGQALYNYVSEDAFLSCCVRAILIQVTARVRQAGTKIKIFPRYFGFC